MGGRHVWRITLYMNIIIIILKRLYYIVYYYVCAMSPGVMQRYAIFVKRSYCYYRRHIIIVTYVKSVSSLIISCLYMSSSRSTCALSFDPDSLHAWSAPEAINVLDNTIYIQHDVIFSTIEYYVPRYLTIYYIADNNLHEFANCSS